MTGKSVSNLNLVRFLEQRHLRETTPDEKKIDEKEEKIVGEYLVFVAAISVFIVEYSSGR